MFINEIYTYLAQTTVLLPSFGLRMYLCKKTPPRHICKRVGGDLSVGSINIVSRSKKQGNIKKNSPKPQTTVYIIV